MKDKPSHRYQQDKLSSWRAIAIIIGLLCAWGIVLAIGAMMFDSNGWRALSIFVSLALFASCWLTALKLRKS